MLKKMIFVFLFCISFKSYSQSGDSEILWAFNSPLSFQQGFGFKEPTLRRAIDCDITIGLLNCGYNYQQYYGSNGYIGIGLFSILQIQYGYGFRQEKSLLRIRSDIPFALFSDNSYSRLYSFGFYYEHTYDDGKKGETIGISVGANLAGLLLLF